MDRLRSARQPLFYDAESQEDPEGAGPRLRQCEHPECNLPGKYPAPKSREPRDGRRWFCLNHVRQYNLGWDFFRGMNPEEVERYQREDVIGHRPTWSFGSKPVRDEPQVWVKDDLGILADVGLVFGAERRRSEAELRLNPQEREALAELGFDLANVTLPLKREDIKSHYKSMVKRFHPDANGGDKDAEERLKNINRAYAFLQSRGYT